MMLHAQELSRYLLLTCTRDVTLHDAMQKRCTTLSLHDSYMHDFMCVLYFFVGWGCISLKCATPKCASSGNSCEQVQSELAGSQPTGSVCEQLLRLLEVENLFCKIPFYDPPQIPLKHTMQMRQLMQMRLSFSLTSTEQIWERYSRCGCMLAPLQDCAT